MQLIESANGVVMRCEGKKEIKDDPAVVPENSDVKGCHRDGKDMKSSCLGERKTQGF